MAGQSDRVGYGQPPKKFQFRKGRSGNPKGRPRKQKAPPADNSAAAILQRLDDELVQVAGGGEMTRREFTLRLLYQKAQQGDLRAIKMLEDTRRQFDLGKAPEGGGVLVVAPVPDADTWEIAAAAQQAKYREAPKGEPAQKLDPFGWVQWER